MSAFSELAGDIGGQWSRGFASGMVDENQRAQQLKWQKRAYQELVPEQLKTYEAQKQIDQRYRTPIRPTVITKGARGLLLPDGRVLQFPPEEDTPDLMGLLGQKVTVPQNPEVMPAQPGSPSYGMGEEAASGTVPRTREISGQEALMIRLGLNPQEREAVPNISTTGKMGLTFQKKTTPPEHQAKEYTLPDGSRWRSLPSGEQQQLSPPIKTAQPWTPELAALRAVQDPENPNFKPEFAAWQPGQVPSPAHQAAATQFGKVQVPGAATKERVAGGLEARKEKLAIIGEIKTAEELAKRDPRVIQRELDKIDKVQQITLKYAPAIEQARNLARPMGEAPQTQMRLYENTLRSLDQMRREYTDDELARYAGIWNRGENYIAQVAGTDQKFMRFLVLNEHLRSTAFQYGGKQLTPFEAAVVFGFTPHGREIFKEQYLEKMDLLEERTHFELGRTKYLATTPKGAVVPFVPPGTEQRQGGKNVPPGTVAPSKTTTPPAPTATGPNGEKLILQNGQWVPYGR